jgi:hypothetical protein
MFSDHSDLAGMFAARDANLTANGRLLLGNLVKEALPDFSIFECYRRGHFSLHPGLIALDDEARIMALGPKSIGLAQLFLPPSDAPTMRVRGDKSLLVIRAH